MWQITACYSASRLQSCRCFLAHRSRKPSCYIHRGSLKRSQLNFVCIAKNQRILMHFRSIPPSRPNNIGGGLKCPSVGTSVRTSVRPYVRPSTKSFSDFSEIWYIDRGPWLMYNSMPYDPIQGQGQSQGASEVPKIALFKVISFTLNNGSWQMTTDS